MRKLYYFLILLISISCSRELDSSLIPFDKKVVLNGILQKDSLLKIHLTFNLKNQDSSEYPIIENAQVSFFENNQAIGQGVFQNNHYFIPNYRIKENTTYKVVANIPNYGTLEAEDFVPSPLQTISIKGEYVETDVYYSEDKYANLHLTIPKPNAKQKNIWLQAASFGNTRGFIDTLTNKQCYSDNMGNYGKNCIESDFYYFNPLWIGSNSRLIDAFNYRDIISDIGRKIFIRYIRIDPNLLTDNQNLLELNLEIDGFGGPANPGEDHGSIITIFNCSDNMDKYFKTSIINKPDPEADSGPFGSNPFQEPASIYSNVKNGLGIFGGIAKTDYYIYEIPYQSP